MKWIKVLWKHDQLEDPVVLLSEIDEDHWELRKIEIYADGRLGYADANREVGGTRLGIEPVPPLQEIAANDAFELQMLTEDEFEQAWRAAMEAANA